MQSRSGNPLATLMLSLPLMAIPLMAVFGVPQFVPVVASSTSDADHQRPRPRRVTRVGESATPKFVLLTDFRDPQNARDTESLDDLFRPSDPARSRQLLTRAALTDTSRATSASHQTSTDSRLADLFGTTTAEVTESPDRLSESVALPSRLHGRSQTRPVSNDGLTWRQAVRQLNQLGVHEYRLEPGSQPGDFYFACEFAPSGDARVIRRFESEASEPLQAVESVLKQIHDWNSQR